VDCDPRMTIPDDGTFVDRSNSQQRFVVRRAPPLPGTTTFAKTSTVDVHARIILRATRARGVPIFERKKSRFEGTSIKRDRREFARYDTERVRSVESEKKNCRHKEHKTSCAQVDGLATKITRDVGGQRT